MPLINYQPGVGIPAVSDYDAPDPSFLETLGAAFRQDNIIGSAATLVRNNMDAGNVSAVDPSYNVYDDADMADYLRENPALGETIFSKPAADAKRAQIDQERKDKQTLEASGWTGVGLSMVASVADPTVLLPGGALARSGRVGYSVARSAAAVGVAAGAGAAVQEAALQATQETRTAGETAMAVGGSVILGGIIGGAASRLFSGAEWSRVSKQLEADLADDVPDPTEVTRTIVQRMQSAGAAASDDIDMSDLGIGGPRAADLVARATAAARINPGVQTMLSPSVKVRETYGRLVDNPIYTTMNMEGRSLGADVENSVKLYERGAVAKWLRSSSDLYRKARKEGFTGSRAEFNKAVAYAGRRGDTDVNGNQYVTQAAQEARAVVFDPLLARAKELELLPEDVKTTTAASYVTRLWNRQRLIGEEERFRRIARDYFAKELDRAVIRQEEIQVGNKIISANVVDDKLTRAMDRLSNLEERMAKRTRTRGAILGRVKGLEARRFDVLKERAPKPVLEALREGSENDNLVRFVREARSAERIKGAKTPVLSFLRKRGGVRIGSPLAGELNAMGIQPQSFPGLFKKGGGRGAVDNIVREDFDLFDTLPVDDNGYVDQGAILDAIRAEVAGTPLRSGADEGAMANAEAMGENAAVWLKSLGLNENATIKEIREFLANSLKAEKVLDETDAQIAKLNQELEEFDKVTDAITNERIISDAETRKLAAELRALEDEINASDGLTNASPAVSRMVDYAKARRDFGKARYDQVTANKRYEKLRQVDSEGRLTPELEAEMNRLDIEMREIGARVNKARAKSEKLKPMLPKQKQEIPDFVSPEDRADYIEEIVTSVFNNLTGRGVGDVPEWLVPVTRGPLKDRVFNIADDQVEDFLENDMELVLRRYARTMGAEVELAQKFGRADMRDQLEEITAEYDALRKAAKTPEERLKLDAAEKRDMTNLKAFRDMIRGTYRASDEGTSWSKITRTALTFNYVRLMGGVLLTSITDTANIIGKHGVRAAMREGLPALVKGTKAAKLSRQEAQDLGVVVDRVLQSRLATLSELQDPYRMGSPYERFLSNASNLFSKATGLALWNDTLRTVSAVMTQNRILRNITEATRGNAIDFAKLDKYERAYMGFLGVDEQMAARISSQFQRYGIDDGGIKGANSSRWDDDVARRAWAAALNKDVDRTIIVKGVADNPLWMKTNTGKLIAQFKSFALATHQRILIAGLQERPHRLLEATAWATGMGMLISYLKYAERGDMEEANKLLENPGLWVANGLDRSGILAIPFEISNTLEKWGSPVGITKGISVLAGDGDQSGGASRYASRNKLGAILGPTAGMFEDLVEIARQMGTGDLKESGANAIIRQVPGGTLPGFRSALQIGVKPAFADAVQ
ncbi:hypothetical protein ACQKP1_15820 [Allorhizobium sp. NPDC080224]|uniref:hypothetical protein n=1 Tax=Allorhizobium sp. NPDC080224 TaxID=3390547 RepID=UPI003D06EEC9